MALRPLPGVQPAVAASAGWPWRGAFVFQALALHNGQMSVVQPLLVTELVFALVLRRLWIHQQIRGGHLVGGRPHLRVAGALRRRVRAHRRATPCRRSSGLGRPPPWRPLGRRRSWPWSACAARRCAGPACLGAATSILVGARRHVHQGDHRHAHPVRAGSGCSPTGPSTRWPWPGIAAELLNQAALHVGPLSVSQPFIVIVDPIVSIALSVWIFAEMFTDDRPPARGWASVGLRRHVRRGGRPRAHGARHDGPRARPGYISPSGKKLTQFVCMDAPSAMIVAPHT